MKLQTFYGWILVLLIIGTSCNHPSKTSIFQKKATGFPYEVLVVMDAEMWEGTCGSLLKKQLTASIPGLPQREPKMRIMYASPSQFDGLLTYVRNIIRVRIDPTLYTKVSVSRERDRWAIGQEVITLRAPSADLLSTYLSQEGEYWVDWLLQKELERRVSILDKGYSMLVYEKVKDRFGISFYAPEEMSSFKDTTDFFWTTNHGKRGRTDFVIYQFPYESDQTFTVDYLVAKRDSIMQIQIPGGTLNSYMTTFKQIPPTYEVLMRNGSYCGVMRGLWEMEGDMMGGPFVSYARLDSTGKQVIVTETFVYAPNTDKAKLIRRAEASLYACK